jgi:hypothetical protein
MIRREKLSYQLVAIVVISGSAMAASTTKDAKATLSQLLLGQDVRALLDMPAYKDGLDVYLSPDPGKKIDSRGIDMKDLSKYLKDKGVGVERDEWVTVTDVKVDSDRVEIHLGGGGEGRGASKNANKKGAGYKRAGGTRVNFRYGHDLTDADIQPNAFLPVLGRVVDTSRVNAKITQSSMAPEFQKAIQSKTVVEGMTYQMVLMSSGEPDQKKVDDTNEESLKETWYYLKEGHRWVVKFIDGKVTKVQVY